MAEQLKFLDISELQDLTEQAGRHFKSGSRRAQHEKQSARERQSWMRSSVSSRSRAKDLSQLTEMEAWYDQITEEQLTYDQLSPMESSWARVEEALWLWIGNARHPDYRAKAKIPSLKGVNLSKAYRLKEYYSIDEQGHQVLVVERLEESD